MASASFTSLPFFAGGGDPDLHSSGDCAVVLGTERHSCCAGGMQPASRHSLCQPSACLHTIGRSGSTPAPLQGRLTQRTCQSWRTSLSRCCWNPSRSCLMRATPACRAPWQQPVRRRGDNPPSCLASCRPLMPHLCSCCNQQRRPDRFAAQQFRESSKQVHATRSQACRWETGACRKLIRGDQHTIRLQATFQRTCGRQPVATSFSSCPERFYPRPAGAIAE